MPQIMDEETPLLRDQPQNTQPTNSKTKRTPLPWRQFSILLLLQVSEPLTSQVIAPFLPQLIRDVGVTNGEDSRVAYYVGLLHSMFFLTEACTIFHWSRTSDRIGRKPVLLIGLFGLSVSMWCFGLSKTFWSVVVSRCLNGALNGNVGVMKSMTIEITDPTNIAQAFGVLPISWALGNTIGPLIGGSLARPAQRFPGIFGDSAFLKEYPYFLPCSVVATVTTLSWLIALVSLTETVKQPTTLWRYLFGRKIRDDKPGSNPQVHSALHGDPISEAADKQLPFRALLTRRVLIATGSYATFSLVEIAFRAIVPVFYAMPIEMGGLNLGPPVIGIILALLGITGGVAQVVFFAPIHDWLGAKLMYTISVSLWLPTIALFPVINAAARVYGVSHLVWFLVGLQTALFIFTSFAWGILFIYVGASAPNKASIGATNGIAQMTVSITRAFGPAAVNSAFSLGIEKHIMGGYFAYWLMVAMAGLMLWVGSLLPRNPWREG